MSVIITKGENKGLVGEVVGMFWFSNTAMIKLDCNDEEVPVKFGDFKNYQEN